MFAYRVCGEGALLKRCNVQGRIVATCDDIKSDSETFVELAPVPVSLGTAQVRTTEQTATSIVAYLTKLE
jgi:hypothetical protein